MAAVSKIEHGVVELRTDVGRLYVCPSGWQRLYLRWTFRNFHCLPQQILNRRQKLLMENLCRTAVLTSSERVPASCIIGVVENMRVLGVPSVVEPAAEVKTAAPQEARLAVLQATAEQVAEASAPAPAPRRAPVDEPRPVDAGGGREEEIVTAAPSPAESGRSYGRFWAAAAVIACAALVAMVFWLVPLARVPQLALAPAPVPQAPPLALERKPAAPAKRTPPAARQATGQDLARAAASPVAPAAADAVSNAAPLPQIVEAPRSGFIYPVAPNPNLVGKVVLKAVVGSDGSVKQVAVLSGDRALAAAAVRAMRHWRYAPAEVGGHTVEAETHVTISFLGDDAVSIILPQPR